MGPASVAALPEAVLTSNFRIVACSASPANYTLPSTLKVAPRSFGLGRDKFQKVVLKTAPLVNTVSPGPSAYNCESRMGKDALRFTLRSRTKLAEEFAWRKVPGPDNYAAYTTITPMGRFRLSSIRDTGAPKFSPPSSARFSQLST